MFIGAAFVVGRGAGEERCTGMDFTFGCISERGIFEILKAGNERFSSLAASLQDGTVGKGQSG